VRYRAVVFDLWDTLVLWPYQHGGAGYAEMAELVGIAPDRFETAWRGGYHERATGSLVESTRRICEALAIPLDRAEDLVAVRHEQTRTLLVPRPGALDVLKELRRRGYKSGLISVCSEEVPALWGETPLAPLIDAPVFSCSVGVAKPDRRIYEIAAERLGVAPSECLFVDDQPAFVEGAVAAGMDAALIRQPDGHPAPEGSWDGLRVERLDGVLELVE
jgi:putative hydrolase of the HAD superfamily